MTKTHESEEFKPTSGFGGGSIFSSGYSGFGGGSPNGNFENYHPRPSLLDRM